MSTDEEYLDNLLKTMSTDDTEDNDDNKIMSLMNETDPMKNRTAPMRKEVFSDIRPEDEIPSADPGDKDADTETREDWSTPADKKDDEKKPVDDESWKAELDEMLAKADKAQEALGEMPDEPEEENTGIEKEETGKQEPMKQKSDTAESEIPTNETSHSGNMEENKNSEEEPERESIPEKPVGKKKEKKRKHSLFGKKKKEKTAKETDSAQAEPAEMADTDQWDGAEKEKVQPEPETDKKLTDGDNDDSVDWTSLLGGNSNDQAGQENGESFEEPDWADEIPEKNEKKKKGFFGNLLETLFREEPDVEETEEKPEKEKKKKEKKGKGKGKAKATEAEAEGGEEAEGKEAEDKKAEKKREKQQKKEEKKRKKEQEPKQPKVLNRKSLLTLIAFDATVIAAVLLLGIFLPDFIDRREARNAFYDGDYVTVYQDLHGKGLGESDTVLLKRAAVVEKLQRKLDSYQINERIGNRAQALDALLSGVAVYDNIMSDGNIYGVESELAILYQQIIDTLQSQFQVDEATAREVNSYESDDDYSEAVYSLINNGKLPESETEEVEETENPTEQLPDLLPEEEDLMEDADSSF